MNVTREEYLRAARLVEKRRGLLSYSAPVLGLAVVSAALAVWGFVADGRIELPGLLLLAVAVIMVVLVLAILPRAAKKRAQAAWPAYEAIVSHCTLTVAADGITLSGDCVFTYDFGRMVGMIEAPDMCVLLVDIRRFVVCPKRALDETQLRALRHGCARKTYAAK